MPRTSSRRMSLQALVPQFSRLLFRAVVEAGGTGYTMPRWIAQPVFMYTGIAGGMFDRVGADNVYFHCGRSRPGVGP